MSSPITFFAIHADDVARACSFYEKVFGWTFEPWGPPDFFLIQNEGHVFGAVQPRLEPLEGRGLRGFECSITVTSVEETARLIETHGGVILMEKAEIPGVGWLIKFRDTEGNEAAAVTYSREVS